MKICYFGIYDKDYSRNRVLMKGLKANGVEIVECHSGRKGIIKYFDLAWKFAKLKKDFDLVLVAFPGQQAMILARFLTRKKIVFDAFTSLYDSLVDDRQAVAPGSAWARYYWWLDRISCLRADKVLLDTNEHIKYFTENFNLPREKFIRVFVGSDISDYAADHNKPKNEKLEVVFYGSFIPLQGIDKVIKAADLLKDRTDIHFTIIGSKIKEVYRKEYPLPNAEYVSNVSYAELAGYIARADVCLGIFGDTAKAERVIANKVYDGVAMGKVVITKESPAIKELFENGHDVILASSVAEDIALQIQEVSRDDRLKEKIEVNAALLGREKLVPAVLIKDLLLKIKE